MLTNVNKGEGGQDNVNVSKGILKPEIKLHFAQSLHSKSNNFAFCHAESTPHGRGGGSTLVNIIMEGFL